MNILRQAREKIVSQLKVSPAVVILGPRQVGKTTLALDISQHIKKPSIYLDLERPSDLQKMSDPELYLEHQSGKLVILDEVQRTPELFPILRSVIDERRRSGEKVGQFLLLGSASLDLIQNASESLAGRISYMDLGVLNIQETGLSIPQQNKLWLRGGFPESFLSDSDQGSFGWRESFIMSYLERDIPLISPRIPAETLRRFWMMIAHNQGQMINASNIASGLGVSTPTVIRYVDLLIDLLLLRSLKPWASNVGKRLVKSPKIYIRDSGLTHALLNIQTLDQLQGHPVVGGSWEGFVIENILSVCPSRTNAFFYRTSAGAEIDLILEISSSKKIAIEIKRSLSPQVSKGFYIGCQDIGVREEDRYLVYPGKETYPVSKDVQAIPLDQLMERLKKFL